MKLDIFSRIGRKGKKEMRLGENRKGNDAEKAIVSKKRAIERKQKGKSKFIKKE